MKIRKGFFIMKIRKGFSYVLKHILQVNNVGKDTIDNNEKEAPAGPSEGVLSVLGCFMA